VLSRGRDVVGCYEDRMKDFWVADLQISMKRFAAKWREMGKELGGCWSRCREALSAKPESYIM